jgi:hypothetical protein
VTAAAGGAMLTFGSKRHGFETAHLRRVLQSRRRGHDDDGRRRVRARNALVGRLRPRLRQRLRLLGFQREDHLRVERFSAQVMAYVAPVMLRFGRQPTFELGLNSGATVIFAHDVRPYGYLYGAILF